MRSTPLLVAPALVAVTVFASPTGVRPLQVALTVDEHQGDQWDWIVDHEPPATGGQAAFRESGAVALRVGRCAAYAAKHDDARTGLGWADSSFSRNRASQRALAERRSRGGLRWMARVEHDQLILRSGENERRRRSAALAFSHVRLVAAIRSLPNLAQPGQATGLDPFIAAMVEIRGSRDGDYTPDAGGI